MREWLKDLRCQRDLTQKQMGEKLDISESYYSYIEAGDRQRAMDISLARKLSSILGISIEQIVEFENGSATRIPRDLSD